MNGVASSSEGARPLSRFLEKDNLPVCWLNGVLVCWDVSILKMVKNGVLLSFFILNYMSVLQSTY
jgi:hypothetical protein